MTTKTVDEWSAAQCGVEFINNRYGWFWYPQNHAITEEIESVKWTIQDPRCREIVRWKLRINTNELDEHDWIATKHYTKYDWIEGRGGCIAEAECNCITAIFEASQ